ncbi:MAG: hypothetical protein ABIP90_04650, partial [Vicinamibacterales bacterium]
MKLLSAIGDLSFLRRPGHQTRRDTRGRLGAVAIAVAISAIACAQPNGPDSVATELPIERFRSEPYSFAFYSGIDTPERLVIRNLAAWGAAWAQIHARQVPAPPLPTIDFSTRTVIVVAMGTRPTGGYGIV